LRAVKSPEAPKMMTIVGGETTMFAESLKKRMTLSFGHNGNEFVERSRQRGKRLFTKFLTDAARNP